ncbi:MAG: MFS transporter [Chloroflexi bacterium]|nr:MAG: MFS transporter [Chloroflexota bacterium]
MSSAILTPVLRRMRRPRPGQVFWLLAGQFVMFAGVAAIFPVVPLYVRHHGGGAVVIAVFIAGPMIANAVAQLPAGHLADRIGRRPILIGSRLVFVVLAFALFADHGPLWLLGVLRAGQGLCSGAYLPALNAALTDLTPPERRAERFGQLQLATILGLVMGPLVGGVLAVWHENLIFACSGAGAFLCLVALWSVPETRSAAARARTSSLPRGWWRTRPMLAAYAGLASINLLWTMYDVVWPQYMQSRGFGPALIGISISVFGIPMLFLSTPGGRLADRADRRLILGVDLAVAGVCAFIYPALYSLTLILALGVVEAVATVMTEPTLYATVGDAAPESARGRAMGTAGVTAFAGSTVGAAVLGSLYGLRAWVPFWVAGWVLVGAAACCALAVPARRSAVAEDAEAGGLVVGVLEHGDHPAGPDVDGSTLAGKLDEIGTA